jgi:hypothetical protein
MKFLFKLFFGIILLIVFVIALAVGSVFMIEKVVPGILSTQFKETTGYRLDIGSLDLSLLGGSAEVKSLTVRNPEGWPEEGFITVNRAVFDIEPYSVISGGRKVIDEMILDLGPLCIVTNDKKEVNAKALMEKLRKYQSTEEAKETETTDTEVESKPIDFLIHHLVLRADTLRIADYSGAKPKIVERHIDMNIELHDVSNIQQIVAQLMTQGGTQMLMMLSNVQLNLGGESDGKDADGKTPNVVDPLKKSVNSILDSLKNKLKED